MPIFPSYQSPFQAQRLSKIRILRKKRRASAFYGGAAKLKAMF
jgi:hypothetical protein